MTHITIQDFHQNPAAAEEASKNGPVLITEGGQTKHVLFGGEEAQELVTARNFSAPEREPFQGTVWDWVHTLPPLPDDLVDYEFPKIDMNSKPFEFD